jgi:TolB-like protein/tetratricopeptide (TPR) repeat protein
MHSTEISDGSVRDELEKILSSPGFTRSERLSKFLRFVVEEELRGKAAEVKESLVGIEVFGRKPGYDSRQDSVVRTEAAKLRARLSQYYAGDGAADPVVIELPKGGYTPVFRQPERTIEEAAPGPERARPRLVKRLRLTTMLAVLGLVLAASALWWVQHKSAPIPIAVLPLTNLSEDPANDYFADGLTGEIIRNLSIVDGLAVRSQTSSFAFKGKPRNLHEVGRQLQVDYILEGSVQRAGQELRINAQVVRVWDDLPLWSGKFDRELTDVFAIQDEISRGIVNNLRLKLGRGRRRYETSTGAYDLYLRGRALGIERGFSNANRSIGPFEEAIAKDPSFAPAYAGLAQAHAIRSAWFRADVADEVAKMRAAAEKAIQLDPLLAEAHDALGMAYARDAQWDQSEKSFRRAIELDPGGSMSQSHFALFLLFVLGRIDEALQQLRVAEKNDPLSPRVHAWLASVLVSAGRYDEAASHCEKLPADHPAESSCQGRARLWQGRTGEALQILETVFNRDVNEGNEAWGYLGYAYARAGRREDAEKLAATRVQNPFNQAIIFAGLGDKDRTFEALDRAAAVGPVRMGWRLTSPEYALLRGDPRLKALRKKVGLPE